MTFIAILNLIFSGFCLTYAAHSYVYRRGKFDMIDVTLEIIFSAGGISTLATSLKVLIG